MDRKFTKNIITRAKVPFNTIARSSKSFLPNCQTFARTPLEILHTHTHTHRSTRDQTTSIATLASTNHQSPITRSFHQPLAQYLEDSIGQLSTRPLRIAERPLQSQKLSNPSKSSVDFHPRWRKDRFLSSCRRTTPRHCNRSSFSSSGFDDICSSNFLSLSLSVRLLCFPLTEVSSAREGEGGRKREEERKRAKAWGRGEESGSRHDREIIATPTPGDNR